MYSAEGIPPAPVADYQRSGRVTCLLACLLLLVLGAAAHIWYLIADCPLDLSGDEAFYWEWARQLDLSYYEKGPLIAYIIAAGRWALADWSERLVGNEALAVRVPAVLLAALTGLGIYVLALHTLRRPRLALAAVALTYTVPILAAGAGLMTIDTPLACAWVWALVCVHRALVRNSLAAWVGVGLLIALGIMAKYTMLLLFPAVGLLLLTEPKLRVFLRRPGPYVALALGLAGFVPILLWSAQHNWVNFRHVAGQAGVAHGPGLDLMSVLAYIAGQAAVVGIVWLVGIVWAMVDLWRRPRDEAAEVHDPTAVKLLLWAAATPWLLFLGFSVITKIQPNWPVTALLTGVIILPLWLARRLRLPGARARNGTRAFIVAGVLLGGGIGLVTHRSEWLTPLFTWLARGAPPWDLTPTAKYDPTARLRGWSELGAAVGEVLHAERAAGRDPFLLADTYQLAAEIAFYCPGEPTVYSAQSALGGRMSQYDIWRNPVRERAEFVGRPCIYVGALDEVLTEGRDGAPPALPGLRRAQTVTFTLRGQPLQVWTISTCDAFAGFPATARNATQAY